MMSSSLYVRSLVLLPILAASSYCSTAAVYCPVDLDGKSMYAQLNDSSALTCIAVVELSLQS